MVFEMAESEQTFEFPVAAGKIEVLGTEIASSKPEKNEVGLRKIFLKPACEKPWLTQFGRKGKAGPDGQSRPCLHTSNF